ncbi:hypothetical protein [Comamonas sp. JUb58]|nr:hypothetical protein [Comamonas sp. JUb58]
MVFDERGTPSLRKRELTADVTQDIRGERVIGVGDDLGIEFVIT